MKKMFAMGTAALLALGMSTTALAADVNVKVDGTPVAWTDAKPFINKDSRTLVPLRPIANALGLTVVWDAEGERAIFSDGDTTVVFTIDSEVYGIAVGDEAVAAEMDTAAVIENGRTYAPARYLAEAFGYAVGWDGATSSVTISSAAQGDDAPAEETATVWDMPLCEAPDLSGTVWNFTGGLVDGVEMEQSDLDEVLAMYGGSLQFVFNEDGTAQMVQGGGVLEGTYEYLEGEAVGVIFDYNGTELRYACVFTDVSGQLVLMAMDDGAGTMGMYFVQ
ncbi:MAG: copper amine oxidase N-terminal domain-containing protein [Anaerotignum sp.]